MTLCTTNMADNLRNRFPSRGLTKEKVTDFINGEKLTPEKYMEQLDDYVTKQLFEFDDNTDFAIDFNEYPENKETFDMIDYNSNNKLDYEDLMTVYCIADQIGAKEEDEYKEDGKFTESDYENAVKFMGTAKLGNLPDATYEQAIAKTYTDILYSYFEEY